jgi:hypothetical protein
MTLFDILVPVIALAFAGAITIGIHLAYGRQRKRPPAD